MSNWLVVLADSFGHMVMLVPFAQQIGACIIVLQKLPIVRSHWVHFEGVYSLRSFVTPL